MPSETTLKDVYDSALKELVAGHRSGLNAAAVSSAYASAVDTSIAGLLQGSLRRIGAEPRGVAVVALGGYGRTELFPHSDIDLLLLHAGWPDGKLAELNRLLMYPLWDSGRDIGNRARSLKEALQALDEVEEAAAALDSRLIAGDHRLYLSFEAAVVERLTRSRARFFKSLTQATEERHRSRGHAGHLLEPDIRDSAGGLRDMQTLGWASRLLPGRDGLEGLKDAGYLSATDRDAVQEARTFLSRLRVELHLSSGRRTDRLHLAEQDEVALRLGYADTAELPAGDLLMSDVYRHARTVDAIVSSVWDHLLRPSSRRRFRRTPARSVAGGGVIQDGRLEVVAQQPPDEDPGAWMRLMEEAVRSGVGLSRSSVNWLQAMINESTIAWTPQARDAFLRILSFGGRAERVLETMTESGFLEALIPEWSVIRACPQRNPYHRYTVDVHSFVTVAELVASRDSPEPDIDDAWRRVGDPRTLYMAGLLHDIGKGRGGDHAILGAGIARRTVARMGLEASDVDDITFLVREHLTLADAATRRDLDDDRTVREMAGRVPGTRRIAMLFLLTRADSLATGPEAWSAFRSSLVRELYAKTLWMLERPGEPVPSAPAGLAHAAVAAEPVDQDDVRLTAVPHDAATEVVVVARDRPRLFAAICGVLSLRGVNVLRADISTRDDGVAVDVLTVDSPYGTLSAERWESIRDDIQSALAGRLDVPEALARRPAARRPGPPARQPEVVVHNEASELYTIVEVHASDRPGLLYTVVQALADHGCDLRLAKIATYGSEVVDVFYVRAASGLKLDGAAAERLRESIVPRLDEVSGLGNEL